MDKENAPNGRGDSRATVALPVKQATSKTAEARRQQLEQWRMKKAAVAAARKTSMAAKHLLGNPAVEANRKLGYKVFSPTELAAKKRRRRKSGASGSGKSQRRRSRAAQREAADRLAPRLAHVAGAIAEHKSTTVIETMLQEIERETQSALLQKTAQYHILRAALSRLAGDAQAVLDVLVAARVAGAQPAEDVEAAIRQLAPPHTAATAPDTDIERVLADWAAHLAAAAESQAASKLVQQQEEKQEAEAEAETAAETEDEEQVPCSIAEESDVETPTLVQQHNDVANETAEQEEAAASPVVQRRMSVNPYAIDGIPDYDDDEDDADDGTGAGTGAGQSENNCDDFAAASACSDAQMADHVPASSSSNDEAEAGTGSEPKDSVTSVPATPAPAMAAMFSPGPKTPGRTRLTGLPVRLSTAKKRVRDPVLLQQAQNSDAAVGSTVVLTPMRLKKGKAMEFGSPLALTQVRRSTRKAGPQPSIQHLLAETRATYTPNKLVLDETPRKLFASVSGLDADDSGAAAPDRVCDDGDDSEAEVEEQRNALAMYLSASSPQPSDGEAAAVETIASACADDVVKQKTVTPVPAVETPSTRRRRRAAVDVATPLRRSARIAMTPRK